MHRAQRLSGVPPYLFAEIDRRRAEVAAQGVDIISLGIGDPDQPSPAAVIREVQRQAELPENHRYPDYIGLLSFRTAVAAYYGCRFGVELDPRTEVMTVIGSKEGLTHLIWALIDDGDYVLVPDPGYPVYAVQTRLAGGRVHYLPLRRENNFWPDLAQIPTEVAKAARLLFLNYPNNPTGAVATEQQLAEALDFARQYDLVLCHDAAYVDMTFDGFVAPSILQLPGAKERAIEFYSLSKPFNMTGWRLGAAVGNAEVLNALGIVKTNTDSGQWNAIQRAGELALGQVADTFIPLMNQLYTRRRDVLVDGLRSLGWSALPPKGSFYLWVPVPGPGTATEWAERLLVEAGVLVTPGSAYGAEGEGYIRMALTVGEDRLREAVERLRQVKV